MSEALPTQAGNFESLIALERAGPDLFRNRFSDLDFQGGHMFGGQLVAQALAAAQATFGEKPVRSLHGYFLQRGDVKQPTEFHVQTLRDGRSFSTRRVSAVQGGRTLFEMLCSASVDERGPLDHQALPPPNVPPPDELRSFADLLADPAFSDCRDALERLAPMPLVDCRPTEPERIFRPHAKGPVRVWVRLPSLTGSPSVQTRACAVAYLQDYWIAIVPWFHQAKAMSWQTPSVASIDGNVWFHRPAPSGWMLYELDSPAGTGGLGLTQARLLDPEGRVIASCAQEVLFRT